MASDDTSFGLALRFTVDVGNTSLGTWSKCEGIEMHFDTVKYQEGGAPGATWNYTHYATGRANYVPIKLTRAVTPQASTALLKWLSQQASSPAAPQPATITLLDTNGQQVQQWTFQEVFPTKYSGPRLDASHAEVAMEELELTHQGFM
jgi:phage tail-like protein